MAPTLQDFTRPFDALTPERVVDALSALGLVPDGRITALNSYENRVYLAHLEQPWLCGTLAHEAVVLKFYRPGRWTEAQILEEHEFAAELAAAEVPVVAPLAIGGATLHRAEPFWFSVSPRRGGRAPELDEAGTREWIGRFLARLHLVGARRPFVHRPAIDAARFLTEPRDWLLAHEAIASQARDAWYRALEDASKLIASHELLVPVTARNESEDAAQTGLRALRTHGDCHLGNILWTPADRPGGGPHFVDLDDCTTSFAVQDVWMLLSGSRSEQQGQLLDLIDGYEQVRTFDARELALIEPLRTLRLVHYSAWLARRAQEPAFVAAFPWFGTPAYWQEQVILLQDPIEAMHEPPLVV